MRPVLCCGNTVLDILAGPVAEPGWGQSTWIDFLEQALGGNGANSSLTLARLRIPVHLISAVGKDNAGDQALAILKAAGVGTDHLERLDAPTPSTVVLVREDGARALLHRPGASRTAFAEYPGLPKPLLQECGRFHLANLYALPGLRPIAAQMLREAHDAGLLNSLDTGWDARGEWMELLAACLASVDLLFVNEDEARQLTGASDVKQSAELLQQRGPATIVVKLGGAGCLVHHDGLSHQYPGFAVKVVDTTGAGDCFAGGFLAALERGLTLPEAARFANAVGALSVQSLGSTTGVRDWDETLEWQAAHKVSLST